MSIKLVNQKQRKYCPKCNQVKDISEFSVGRGRKGGHQGWCKSCMSVYWTSEERREAMRALWARKKLRYEEQEELEPEPKPRGPEEAVPPVQLPDSLTDRGISAYEPVEDESSSG